MAKMFVGGELYCKCLDIETEGSRSVLKNTRPHNQKILACFFHQHIAVLCFGTSVSKAVVLRDLLPRT